MYFIDSDTKQHGGLYFRFIYTQTMVELLERDFLPLCVKGPK